MAEPHLTDLQFIVDDVLDDSRKSHTVSCRHFFGGAAAYADGQIFMSLSSAGLAIKLPEKDRDMLLGQGGKPLRYFAKAPVKKDYVVLPDDMTRDSVALKHWACRSIESVSGGTS